MPYYKMTYLPTYRTVSTLAGCFTVNAASANTDWLDPYKYCMCALVELETT